ncbi:hypothetical protein PWJ82_07465 [Actinotignum schaalii]|nr:hypothetical protein [Actinotignum schaalii]MDE1655063.1 hypothetical protein [Actinotignum schaalii]
MSFNKSPAWRVGSPGGARLRTTGRRRRSTAAAPTREGDLSA